jgi:hypothetical protein
MNRLETAFLKNWNLKTQKSAYSNRKQCGAFLKTQYFKRLTDVQILILASARIVCNIVYVQVRDRIHRELCCEN